MRLNERVRKCICGKEVVEYDLKVQKKLCICGHKKWSHSPVCSSEECFCKEYRQDNGLKIEHIGYPDVYCHCKCGYLFGHHYEPEYLYEKN